MKRWNILSEYVSNKNISEQILLTRGITQVEDFINTPSISDYFSLFSVELKNSLKKAKNLIEEAIKSENTIVIYGDYDADGICSTAILYNTIKNERKYDPVIPFIPNRFEHGYGLSIKAIQKIIDEEKLSKGALFITVDTGVTATEEISFLKEKGFQVIVLDHHQKPEVLPSADCLVWDDQVVACSLAWLLSKVIGSKDLQSVSLVALATVTDLQPLIGFNRSVVKKGLEILNTKPPLGVSELIKAAGRTEAEITTYDLGWVIGPRLNASGRLVDAKDSLTLLTEKDGAKVKEAAQTLNNLNNERQSKTLEMYELASNYPEGELPKITFSENENYHEGIIGLVAAKLVQKYHRPAIVISLSDGFGKGSARSIKGVDIIKFLRLYEDLFENLGGHPMAAGFNIKKENITTLKNRMLSVVDEHISEEALIPDLIVDLKIPIEIVSLNLVNEIERLKPFGLGNEEPLFMSENLGVAEINSMGKDNQHLRLKLYQEGKNYKAVYFGGGQYAKDLKFGDRIDIVYSLKKNEYNGNVSVDLVLKDFRMLSV